MSEYYLPAHPSIVRMLKNVIDAAYRHEKSVTLCGEIASNPHFIPLLLGLGINIFSCPPRYVPIVKRIVRQTNFKRAQELANEVLTYKTPEEIMSRLNLKTGSAGKT